MNQITIDGDRIELADLDALLELIGRVGGPKFELKTQWVVSTPDPLAAYGLEKLLNLKHGEPEPVEPLGEKYHGSGSWVTAPDAMVVPEPVSAGSKEPKEIKAWRVLDGEGNVVEQLTITERNIKMAKGLFAEGTILHHPRAGKQRITSSLPGQGMEPVE